MRKDLPEAAAAVVAGEVEEEEEEVVAEVVEEVVSYCGGFLMRIVATFDLYRTLPLPLFLLHIAHIVSQLQ